MESSNSEVIQPVAPVESEKTLKQSEVNDLVGRVRKEAREDGYNKAKLEIDSTKAAGITPDQVRTLVNEQAEQKAREYAANQLINEFGGKMVAAKERYPDFDQVVGKVNFEKAATLIPWINSLDNSADVMYDIAKHPSKFASLINLRDQPALAMDELKNLSSSIKTNQKSKSLPAIDEPLDKIKPSTSGIDSGSMTVRDYKKASWLKG
jgi:hypothetical protein